MVLVSAVLDFSYARNTDWTLAECPHVFRLDFGKVKKFQSFDGSATD